MFSQKYLYTVLATLSLSFGLRSGILFFFGIDVIKTPFELISVGYYFILAILIPLLHIIIKKWLSKERFNLFVLIKLSLLSKGFLVSIFILFLISYGIRINLHY